MVQTLQNAWKIPELRKKLLLELHRIWQAFPVSSDYMTRLVRRLTGDEGPVRLAILRQFLLHTDFHTAPVVDLIKQRMDTASRKTCATLEDHRQRQFQGLFLQQIVLLHA